MTQEALAERAGLTANAISALERVERQRPYPHTVLALAAALGLDDQARTAFVAAARQGRASTRTAGAARGGEADHDRAPTPPVSPAHPSSRGTDAADQHLRPEGTRLAHTKLAVPALRPDVVARPHLLAALQRALAHHPLTLVSAPAGSGKTTLLAAFATATPNVRWAWFSLDEVDNDPVRFFNGIAAALHRGGIHAAPRLDTGAPDAIRRWMADLINALQPPHGDSRAGLPCVLVLDDLHAITEPAIFAMLDYLIERLPSQLRLCLATRHDPPLALSRLRARRHLFEMRLPALRFTAAETATLLNTTLELDVAPEQVAAVAERTEG
jgi:DNA-binding XRE family transcriptional regulator